MSKKTNTLWFILGATVFNIIITIIFFVIFLAIFSKLPGLPVAVTIPIILIGPLVLSFVVYRFILKQMMKKIDMEKHFDPIFSRRKK